jgi:hypothetical protein
MPPARTVAVDVWVRYIDTDYQMEKPMSTILKTLNFVPTPARTNDPIVNRRANLVARLEEQQKLLEDPPPGPAPPSASVARARPASSTRRSRESPRGFVRPPRDSR